MLVDSLDGYTPTPAVSHAILTLNRGKAGTGSGAGLADGIVVTPSHNPPADGGFKYNPTHGGPADTDATSVIAARANELIRDGLSGVRRVPLDQALGEIGTYDFMGRYVDDLPNVVDLAAIKEAGVRIGADPLGGASVAYWGEIGKRHGLDLTVVNPEVDPHVAVHDPRLGRQDPDGLLVAVGHGVPDRPQGRVRHRHRQRRRLRPARHRHARRRADEPEPLPRRRDPVPLRRGASRVAVHARRSARRWSRRR